jgi:hypothetical protein
MKAVAFGRRQEGLDMKPVTFIAPDEGQPNERLFVYVTLVALAVFIPLYVSIFVLEMPIERPFAGVFSETNAKLSWAPIWVSPLVCACLSAFVLGWAGFTGVKPSLSSVTIASSIIVYLGTVITEFIKNIGYTVLTVHADWKSILEVSPKMFQWHMVEAIYNIVVGGPELLLLPPLLAGLWWFYENNRNTFAR